MAQEWGVKLSWEPEMGIKPVHPEGMMEGRNVGGYLWTSVQSRGQCQWAQQLGKGHPGTKQGCGHLFRVTGLCCLFIYL